MTERTLKLKFVGDTSGLDSAVTTSTGKIGKLAGGIGKLGGLLVPGAALLVGAGLLSETFEDVTRALTEGDLPGAIEELGTVGGKLGDSFGIIVTKLSEFVGSGPVVIGILTGIGAVIALAVIPALVGMALAMLPVLVGIGIIALAVAGLLTAWETNFLGIRDITKTVADTLKTTMDVISGVFDAVVGHIMSVVSALVDSIAFAVEQWNNLQALLGGGQHTGVQGVLDRIRNRGDPRVEGPGRHFAKGGIVRSPTRALIGEAGPEAVIPLDKLGGMGGVTVNVYGFVGSEDQLGRAINRALVAYQRRGGRIGVH